MKQQLKWNSKIKEGKCVQALHEGPFENEEYTLNRIEKYVETQGLVKNGYHHEIYLVNFTKEKNKNKYRTILREPVKSKILARSGRRPKVKDQKLYKPYGNRN